MNSRSFERLSLQFTSANAAIFRQQNPISPGDPRQPNLIGCIVSIVVDVNLDLMAGLAQALSDFLCPERLLEEERELRLRQALTRSGSRLRFRGAADRNRRRGPVYSRRPRTARR